jgi:TPR repeat protein
MTELGRIVERNPARAAQWYEKACDLGSGDGCLYYGRMLRIGDGIQRDDAKGREILLRACTLGTGAGCVEAQQ